jgi:hypothetical protein
MACVVSLWIYSSSHLGIKMITKLLYLSVGVALMFVALYLNHLTTEFKSGGEHELFNTAWAFFGLLLLAVLTFPIGVLGVAVGISLGFAGVSNIPESLFIAALISLPLGFWQWFKLFPSVFKS